mmetsp:Transcript_33867/g.85255  ORF Transcript_33867/g.85255 Transcript_33867/m.85255 type:complete len:251 (+) Transcript_33867:450-1202(+)
MPEKLSEMSMTASEGLNVHFPVFLFSFGPSRPAMARAPLDSMRLPDSRSALKFDGNLQSPRSLATILSASAMAVAPSGPIPQLDRSSTVSDVLNIEVPLQHSLGLRAAASAEAPASPRRGFSPKASPRRHVLKIQSPSAVFRGVKTPSASARHPAAPMSLPCPSISLMDEANTHVLEVPLIPPCNPSPPDCCRGQSASATASAIRSPRLKLAPPTLFACAISFDLYVSDSRTETTLRSLIPKEATPVGDT